LDLLGFIGGPGEDVFGLIAELMSSQLTTCLFLFFSLEDDPFTFDFFGSL